MQLSTMMILGRTSAPKIALQEGPSNARDHPGHDGCSACLAAEGRRRLGLEFKRTVAPKVTKSMHVAVEDLKLSSLTVIHGGQHTFPLAKKIPAVPASRLTQDLRPLR